MKIVAIAVMFHALSLAEVLDDAAIRAAISQGEESSAKQIWDQIKKHQQFRINRAGLDPIEKKVTFIFDTDRIMLEAAEAKRQMRSVSIDQIKAGLPLGTTEILLEANCYNNLYSASLPKWGPAGGVHLVIKLDGQIIQPMAKGAGPADSVAILPQEHGVVSRNGPVVTYTPLYRTALYERASERTWFSYPAISRGQKLAVIVISSDGNRKEKEIEIR